MSDRLAVYPGSFDPPTFGHLDLIKRATKIFDRVIVGVASNSAKKCLFTAEERMDMLREITKDIPDVGVTSFTGLTAEFAREHGAIALVRGLRAISDFEYELMMAITNQGINPEIDTVCLMPSESNLFLSSGVVKEIARLGGDTSRQVPQFVSARLKKKFDEK